ARAAAVDDWAHLRRWRPRRAGWLATGEPGGRPVRTRATARVHLRMGSQQHAADSGDGAGARLRRAAAALFRILVVAGDHAWLGGRAQPAASDHARAIAGTHERDDALAQLGHGRVRLPRRRLPGRDDWVRGDAADRLVLFDRLDALAAAV